MFSLLSWKQILCHTKKQIRKTNRQKHINMLKTQIHKNKFIKTNSQKQIHDNKFYASKKNKSVKQIGMNKFMCLNNKFIKTNSW